MARDVGFDGPKSDGLGESLGSYAWEALARFPGLGVCVCTIDGKMSYASPGEHALYQATKAHGDKPQGAKAQGPKKEGRASMPEPWIAERLAHLRRAHDDQRSLSVRSLWNGVQLVSVIVPVPAGDAPDGEPSCLVVTQRVAGEIKEGGDVLFSRLVNLGEMSKLSPRELEVLALIGRGLPTRKIAETLDLSPKTVEKHRDAIVRKTGEKSRIRLAEMAHDAGLTPEDAKRERV